MLLLLPLAHVCCSTRDSPHLHTASRQVKAKGKSQKDFANLFLAQELVISSPSSPPRDGTDASAPVPDSASQQGPGGSGGAGAGADEAAGAKKRKAVWAVKFSEDGRYLAVGGKDGVVRGALTGPLALAHAGSGR